LKKDKQFEEILFPYKGTTAEEKTFKQTIRLASSIGSNVTVLTCLEERHVFGFFKTKTSKREFEREYDTVKKRHDYMKQYAKEQNVTCYSKIIKNSFPSIKILEFAKKHNVELIVLTKTTLSSHYEKLHHHSTVENVSKNATCPILIL
jgi:nucleotide-binding universal stress UspA family protein